MADVYKNFIGGHWVESKSVSMRANLKVRHYVFCTPRVC